MATWTDNVLDFAVALGERAAARGYEPFRPECRADVEYLKKAAQLLEMVTRSYIRLSNQVEHLYLYDKHLVTVAEEAMDIVREQSKNLDRDEV